MRAAVLILVLYLAWNWIADQRRGGAFEEGCSVRHGDVVNLEPREQHAVVVHRYFFIEDGGRACVYRDDLP